MSGTKLQSALRELQDFARSRHFWIVFSAIVVLFSVIGPFDTAQTMAAGPRFGFWLINLASATTIAVVCVIFANLYLEHLIGSSFIRILIGALISCVPTGLALMLLISSWHGTELSWREFFSNVGSSLPISFVFTLIFWAAMRHERALEKAGIQPLANMAPDTDPGRDREVATAIGMQSAQELKPRPLAAPLLARMKPENRGPIQRLAAEDHYTLTVTSRGKELVLIRFSDALTELGDTEGLQVHRSHWVARSAFDRLETKNGKATIVTRDGNALPVSRTFAPTVRQTVALWAVTESD